jgi:ribosomal protein S18 acetylase RimI-like enzyme
MQNKTLRKGESLIDKARRVYKEKGALGLFWSGLVRIYEISFDTNSAIWFTRDLEQTIEQFEARIPLFLVSDDPQGMIEWLRGFGRSGLVNPREIEIGLREKHYFPYVRRNDGQIVGGSKIGYGKVYIVDFGRIIDFPEGTAFWYNTYVSPANRGLGIASHLITSCLFFLKEKGFRRVMCHIPKWNKSSIKAFTRCGFKVTRYVRFLRIFNFKFTAPGLNKMIR